MNARRAVLMVTGLIGVALVVFPIQAEEEEEGRPINQKMVTAATQALEVTLARYEVGRATPEEVYIWSRRVVEANLYSFESVAKHLEAMRELHERVVALNQIGGEGGEAHALHASEYYLAEAEGFAAL